jgi:hypothetical protein
MNRRHPRVPPHQSGSRRQNGGSYAAAGSDRVEALEETRFVLTDRSNEDPDRQLLQDREESQGVVRVGVRQDGGIQTRHPAIEKLGKEPRTAEVSGVQIEGSTTIDQDGVSFPTEQEGVALPDVEGLEREAARRPRGTAA